MGSRDETHKKILRIDWSSYQRIIPAAPSAHQAHHGPETRDKIKSCCRPISSLALLGYLSARGLFNRGLLLFLL